MSIRFPILLFLIAWMTSFSLFGSKTNILLIWIDDLRPDLGCYGADYVKTPHIDNLATQGIQFNRAYCQEAICTVSRASLITGQRPDRNGVQRLVDNFRKKNPEAVTIMQQLHKYGYETIGLGKQLHHESEREWTSYRQVGKEKGIGQYHNPEISAKIDELKAEGRAKGLKGIKLYSYSRWESMEAPDVADNQLEDGAMTDVAIEELQRLKANGTPFFMSVGYKKPHLPFVAPKKYWDMYDRSTISTAKNHYFPEGMPNSAKTNWGELRNYRDIPNGNADVSEEKALELIHGYHACITYVDTQVGRLMSALDSSGLGRNTLVILTSDHGFKLGEHKMWCKHTNFEIDLKVPFLVRTPGNKNAGMKSNAIIELVDLFPTICDYAEAPGAENLDGVSIRALINNPAQEGKKYAFSQYPGRVDGKYAMGYSVVDQRFRYTEWNNPQKGVSAHMLYDLNNDPDENKNIVDNPEYSAQIAEFKNAIRKLKASTRK